MLELVACAHCERHAKSSEDECPHCGSPLRDGAGGLRRTATAAMLGLAAVAAGCGPKGDPPITEPVDEYGPAPTLEQPRDPEPEPSASGDPGVEPAPQEPVAEYGPPPTSD